MAGCTPRRFGMLVLATAAVCICGSASQAQTELKWKLQTGEKYNLQLAQDMKMAMMVQGQAINQNVTMGMDMSWNVQQVDAATGVATVVQTFDRMRMNIDTGFGKITVDTKEKQPEGETGLMWEQLNTLVGAKITQQMDPQGKILDVQLDDKAKEAIAKNAQFQQMFSGGAVKEMFGQSLGTLPDKAVSKGDSWQSSSKTKTQFGEFKLDGTYTFEGMTEHDGKQVAKIGIKGAMKLEGANEQNPVKISLKNSEITGTALFDVQAGRMLQNDVIQKMNMNVEAGGQNIDSNITTNIKMLITLGK